MSSLVDAGMLDLLLHTLVMETQVNYQMSRLEVREDTAAPICQTLNTVKELLMKLKKDVETRTDIPEATACSFDLRVAVQTDSADCSDGRARKSSSGPGAGEQLEDRVPPHRRLGGNFSEKHLVSNLPLRVTFSHDFLLGDDGRVALGCGTGPSKSGPCNVTSATADSDIFSAQSPVGLRGEIRVEPRTDEDCKRTDEDYNPLTTVYVPDQVVIKSEVLDIVDHDDMHQNSEIMDNDFYDSSLIKQEDSDADEDFDEMPIDDTEDSFEEEPLNKKRRIKKTKNVNNRSSLYASPRPIDEVFLSLQEKSQKIYIKCWEAFLKFFDEGDNVEARMPTEEEMVKYFTHLRVDLKRASSSLWTIYSMLNFVIKGRYGAALQQYPRLTALIRSFDVDTKKKAADFTTQEIQTFLCKDDLATPYWMVRRVMILLAFFGGLSCHELMNLKIENIHVYNDRIVVKFFRGKKETWFSVPRDDTQGVDCGQLLTDYLDLVGRRLNKAAGRVFWKGTATGFVNQPLGLNMVRVVPKQVAEMLGLDNPANYTFASFRNLGERSQADR